MTSRNTVSADRLSRRAFVAAACAGMLAAPAGCALFNRPKKIDPSVFEPAVNRVTKVAIKELNRHSELDQEKKTDPTVCFLGVKGESAESISEATRAELQDGEGYTLLKKEDVKVALSDAGIRANDVYIPAERKKFLRELGRPVDYFLAGYVEDVEERVDPNDEESQLVPKRVYRLELLCLETNKKSEFVADL